MAMAEQVPIEEVYRRAQSINRHDVCNMQYTSGTTGFPKSAHRYNVVNNGKCIGDCMDLSTADRMLVQVPMFLFWHGAYHDSGSDMVLPLSMPYFHQVGA